MKYTNLHEQYSYDILKTFALTHNYNNWIMQMFDSYIGKEVLEVGCGIGNLTCYLYRKNLDRLVGIDIIEGYVKHLQIDFPKAEFYHIDIVNNKILDFLGKGKFDTVLCVNVLEHIEDDIAALRNMYDLLKKMVSYYCLFLQGNFFMVV